MTVSMSTGLRNEIVGGGSAEAFAAALNGGRLRWFAGTVPANADAATGAAVLLAEFTESGDGSTGLTWDASTVANGVISKTAAEAWQATAVADGTATFFRFCEAGDAGTAASTTAKRFQGTIGPGIGFDLIRPNPAVVTSDSLEIDVAQFAFPA